MSLIDEMMVDCVFVNKVRTSDGEGGYTTVWSDGASFKAAIVLDSSMQARIGEAQGVTSLYTITTNNVALDFHDVIKRVSDGYIFRVTSETKKSPSTASFNIKQVSAEKWSLTS